MKTCLFWIIFEFILVLRASTVLGPQALLIDWCCVSMWSHSTRSEVLSSHFSVFMCSRNGGVKATWTMFRILSLTLTAVAIWVTKESEVNHEIYFTNTRYHQSMDYSHLSSFSVLWPQLCNPRTKTFLSEVFLFLTRGRFRVTFLFADNSDTTRTHHEPQVSHHQSILFKIKQQKWWLIFSVFSFYFSRDIWRAKFNLAAG